MRINIKNQPTKKPTNQRTSKAILFLLFLFILQPTAYSDAADFVGSLKSVSITDSLVTNAPPTAVINYTQNGDTVDFDANGSTDSDGTIAEYRWDFGDGTTGSGVVATHTYSTTGSYPITLTVVDNGGRVGRVFL